MCIRDRVIPQRGDTASSGGGSTHIGVSTKVDEKVLLEDVGWHVSGAHLRVRLAHPLPLRVQVSGTGIGKGPKLGGSSGHGLVCQYHG